MKRIILAALAVSVVFTTTNLTAQESAPKPQDQPAVGRIYMINVARWGYAKPMGFKLDDQPLQADRRSYSFREVPVGLHVVESGKYKAPVSVESGQNYFFTLVEQALGWGGFRLTRLSSEEGEFYLTTLRHDVKVHNPKHLFPR
ncbi:MAG: hypothetical protein LAO03_22735 [Acidobacteriia bacterium]|nr:hypothetical protein [Terriglobia bacterium]